MMFRQSLLRRVPLAVQSAIRAPLKRQAPALYVANFSSRQASSGRVQKIESMDQYQTFVKDGKSVVYFTAVWCPPCKMISPVYDELSSQFPDVKFGKVDVDDVGDVAEAAGIRAMPTFQFHKDGQEMKTMKFEGADQGRLKESVDSLDAQ